MDTMEPSDNPERILGLMNRTYDIGKLLELIKEVNKLSLKTWLYTHIIIGFPTETMEDFLESVKFLN